MHTWFVITGRVAFDDEDTVFVSDKHTQSSAVREFRKEMWSKGKDFEFLEQHPEPPEPGTEQEDEDIVYLISIVKVRSEAKPEIVLQRY